MPKHNNKDNKQQNKVPKKEGKSEDNFDNFSELLEEREKDNKVDKQLEEIYEADIPKTEVNKNKKEDMANFQRKNNDTWSKIAVTFFILLVVLMVASWTGYYIFNAGNRLNNKDIKFTIEGPEEVVVGQEVIYTLQYKNLSQFNLHDVEIKLKYPDGLVPLDVVPTADHDHDIWLLDKVENNRSSRIQVKALVAAAPDSEQTLFAIINYRPENFSSTFDTAAELTSKVVSAGAHINVEAPSFFNLNEETEITIDYVHEKEHYFDNFVILLEHGEEFEVSSDIWEIDNISDKQEQLKIKGKYATKPSSDEELKIIFALPYATSESEEINYAPFNEYIIRPTIVEGALNINLSINGSKSDKAVNAGDSLNYVVHYKNGSEATLKNIIIMTVIDSVAVDWQSLADSADGEIRNNTIIWTKEEISELAKIDAGKEDSFSFSIKTKNWDQLKDTADSKLQVVSYLDYSVDSALAKASDAAVKITNKINSNLSLNNELRYFDRNNISIGEGPLPPKVGEKTTYRAYWTLTNSRHDLANLELKTILPQSTKWENNYNVSVGSIVYNTDTREMNWKIDSWDAIGEPALADFAISITPTEANRNKIMTVLNDASLSAKDTITNGIIIKSSKAKTTNLDDDEVGKGYGKVE